MAGTTTDDGHPTPLPLTGERTAPGWDREAYWLARHQIAYQWIATHICEHTDVVLDIGSGEGYGCAMLGAAAAWVAGVELDRPSCLHAARTYPGARFVTANVVALPFRARSADVVVSLQVMEHVWNVSRYLAELRRITRRVAVVSTPNRPVFSPGLGRQERPTNPFHVEEFDAEQIRDHLADAGFRDIQIFGIHHGERITAWETHHGSIVAALTTATLTDTWPPALDAVLRHMDVADFTITNELTEAHDLIAVGL